MDIGHHEGIDAVARDLAIIDAGHYGTEYMFMEDMKKYFQEQLPETTGEMCDRFAIRFRQFSWQKIGIHAEGSAGIWKERLR